MSAGTQVASPMTMGAGVPQREGVPLVYHRRMADDLEPSSDLPSLSPASSIEEVLGRMKSVADALPPDDGIALFNALYLRTTQSVLEAIAGQAFEDRPFMERLDVVFANRYFEALDAWARTGESETPESWQALFESRRRTDVAPLQFALAGMNAHINFDLGQSVVATCIERGVALASGSPQHRDFLAINDVLARTEPMVKEWFARGVVAKLDRALGSADDDMALWSIRRAREAAWSTAEATWALRGMPQVASAFLHTLDGTVGMAGRALLRVGLSPLAG